MQAIQTHCLTKYYGAARGIEQVSLTVAQGEFFGFIGPNGEAIAWSEVLLLHLAYFLLQIEVAGICFGISAFLRRSGTGIGLGLAVSLYGLNLIANMTKRASFLAYFTPFGYCDGAELLSTGHLLVPMVLGGDGRHGGPDRHRICKISQKGHLISPIEHADAAHLLRRRYFICSFAVLMEEMSITRMLVQAESRALYSVSVMYFVLNNNSNQYPVSLASLRAI